MGFEDILKSVGDYGSYQTRFLHFLLVPALCLPPFYLFDIIFTLSVPDHWCFVPEVSSSNLSLLQQKALISPQTNPSCLMYDVNFTKHLDTTIIADPAINNSQTRPCIYGWQYDKSDYDYTAATQWNLVCDDRHYVSFVMMMHYIGKIIGNPISGFLSDRFGRKLGYGIVLIVGIGTEISSVFMKNFFAFAVLKGIRGCIVSTLFSLPFVLILEMTCPEKRAFANFVQSCYWTVGMCLLAAAAYLSRSWVTLSLITVSLSAVVLLIWSFVPESPLWLLSRDRYEEAFVILKDIARKNKKAVNDIHLLAKLQASDEMSKEGNFKGNKNSALDVLREPQLRKLIALNSICWTATYFIYDGLQLNISNLSGNEFINFILVSVMEIPGSLVGWLLMEHCGRRFSHFLFFMLASLVCVLSVIAYPYNYLVTSITGKFIASAIGAISIQRSSEVFPTVVRCLGLSMCITIANITIGFLPYVLYLNIYDKDIPHLIFGSFCFLAGFVSLFIPETLNEDLPQTIQDSKNFGQAQNFFSFNWQARHKRNTNFLLMKRNLAFRDRDSKISPMEHASEFCLKSKEVLFHHPEV